MGYGERLGEIPEATGKILDDFRLTIPTPFRKAMGVKTGDTVIFRLSGNALLVVPAEVKAKA